MIQMNGNWNNMYIYSVLSVIFIVFYFQISDSTVCIILMKTNIYYSRARERENASFDQLKFVFLQTHRRLALSPTRLYSSSWICGLQIYCFVSFSWLSITLFSEEKRKICMNICNRQRLWLTVCASGELDKYLVETKTELKW